MEKEENMAMPYGEDFIAFIATQLEKIDAILSKNEVEIHDRPMIAADIIVTRSVASVSGDTTDNYLGKPWFKYIMNPIFKWYQSKYGPKSINRSDKFLSAVVLFKGVFYRLKIPTMIEVPNGELIDLHFPKEVLPVEDALSFIIDPPKIITDEEKGAMKESIIEIVNLTRSIHNNLKTVDFGNTACDELAFGIEPHIEKLVEDLLSLDKIRMRISLWELHLALEKSMKVLLCQKNLAVKHTHDLKALLKIIEGIYPGLILETEIDALPSHTEAINNRYGKGIFKRKTEFSDIYRNVLKLVSKATYNFDRKTYMNNAIFTIKKMDWRIPNNPEDNNPPLEKE